MKLTNQELFWKGAQGNKYINRNTIGYRSFNIGRNLLKNKIDVLSAVEIGPNIGHNLDAIKNIYPRVETYGIEINEKAFKELRKKHDGINQSILKYKIKKKFDLVIITGVLMHQDPTKLDIIYSKINKLCSKYIYLSEYFNPVPVEIPYRGERERLFKRDFAKELWMKFKKLKLVDYGFHWKEDPFFKNTVDNTNWFIFKK
tara:strand:- start:217 stop:819 length:603 start_codon:yes stop_codon:yes gene_type:complete